MTAAEATNSETATAAPADQAAANAKLRYAIKTALSLTLAYLIPMGLGWPQPQTAATTVMLIAATGLMSESLQKGILRVLGTVAGAVIGLSLIALFPQDRMLYLFAVSVTVAGIIYLYNAYQGDSTLFMLTAVVTLMVFNGGDAEGSFLYGIDRAFMTAFGVVVYTVVASMLWPVRSADNTRTLAAAAFNAYSQAFEALSRSATTTVPEDTLPTLVQRGEQFHSHFSSVKNDAPRVTAFLPEWNGIVACYDRLSALLLLAIRETPGQEVDYSACIRNYTGLLAHIAIQFRDIESGWQGNPDDHFPTGLDAEVDREKLAGAGHLSRAAVIARIELLHEIQAILAELHCAQQSLLYDRGKFRPTVPPEPASMFIWLDADHLRTALRAFITFWIATAIWINFNPPGGFTFVTLCTILIPLVSYTPVTPRLLFILFTLGFLFAVPAYVFLLPMMTHWLELGMFLFAYSFIGFFVFQGPVSIFFLLGLFTLGIQNEMSYHVDGLLLTMLMFYMICAVLIISVHFPFSSRPEQIYLNLRRRFFRHAALRMRWASGGTGLLTWLAGHTDALGSALLQKMATWSALIPNAVTDSEQMAAINNLNDACDVLNSQLHLACLRRDQFAANPLISALTKSSRGRPLASLCDNLAELGPEEPFHEIESRMDTIDVQLTDRLGESSPDRYDPEQLVELYSYLNLQAAILNSMQTCHELQSSSIDWQHLGAKRF